MQTTLSQTWREITIGPGLVDGPPATDPTVGGLWRALADATEAGVRVVLVHMDSDGGRVDSAFAMYRALRAFSDAGGTVVAHVREYAASTATMVLLAADVIVMDPAARLIVHSMFGGTPEGIQAANAAVREVYERRTNTHTDELRLWLSFYDNDRGEPFFADLRLEAALAGGWTDVGGTVDDARRLAERCAEGTPFFSERRRALSQRDRRVATPGSETFESLTGAKMRQNAAGAAPAFLVDPGGFKIGQTLIRDAWFGKVRPMLIREFGHRTATNWQGTQGAGTNATEYLAAGAWDATNKRIRLLGKNMVAPGFNEMRLSGAVMNGTYPAPNQYGYELVAFYNGQAGADLYIDLELWETLYDGATTSMVRRKVDWNASDGPLFDLSAIFYNSQGSWVGYW